MNEFKKKFGMHLKQLREDAGLTQEKLAEIVEYSVINISRLENGHVFPSLEILLAYSEAFNIEVKELFNFDYKGSDQPPAEIERLNNLLAGVEKKYIKVIYRVSKEILKGL